ncbi:ATP-binding protein [Haloarcula onubensis]|uniref:ATPase n=1 Tax=Haloarcula onubensis TaxID=2950539 RepID=A0ABU2FSL6_9EURY|nr:ATPase [Halomicroarcula sp. S3CR25-11]MDS0283146.1 ATPase [Halomicroarcula sp. S3CR25-11]
MSFVLGRETDLSAGPTGELGSCRALDGSEGAPLYLDLDGPHAAFVVGKRGYGKSYTLGVVAESLALADGVAPVLVDPMGVFDTLGEPADGEKIPTEVIEAPSVTPASLDPRSWCALLGLSPESGPGGLVWQAAGDCESLAAMRAFVGDSDAPRVDRRAARNHLDLAASWGVFDPDGLAAADLASPGITVLELSGLDSAPMNAVVRGVAEALYRTRVDRTIARLPWLLVDEAHTFFDGVARSALETVLTRGRAPGVSLVTATQRPSVVPEVVVSQSDILISHRLTAEADLEALAAARPTYLNTSLEERLPTEPGEVVVVDDTTETVHAATIRQRVTPHGGDNPRASEVTMDK